MEIPKTGALPLTKDYRDVPYLAEGHGIVNKNELEALPDAYTTDTTMLPVLMQNQIPACVAHTVVNLMKLYWYKKTGKVIDFSPRFLDILADPENSVEGRDPRMMIKLANTVGCCTEALLPSDTTLPEKQYRDQSVITQEMRDEAAQWKIPGYAFIPNDEYSIKHAIYHQGMVGVLTLIGAEWWTDIHGNVTWNKDGVDPLRTPNPIVSGHETCFKGWNVDTFRDLNEWSKAWADNGENDLPYKQWIPYIYGLIAIVDSAVDYHPLVKNLPPADQFKHTFTPWLSFGMKGDEVKALQTALMIDGSLHLDPKITLGYFGSYTLAGVKSFQSKYGLLPDGIVGPDTVKELNTLFS